MYVITFYSFKGGVGRTMALVNAAVSLARRGRRVLVADFDLEAPGLTTYALFGAAPSARGLIHYVHSYLETGEAPAIGEYIAHDAWRASEGGSISVMPSGAHDPEYGRRFSELSWRDLYLKHDGYLFFEDVKNQWREVVRPDYVLIDSRTGHTDTGGICTRQLPDAVVAMFSPTEQNLFGMSKVVTDIRGEAKPPRNKNIKLHFVVSNVPDLDDEDRILEKRLARASDLLGYGADFTTIHHYNSLALLEQSIFVLDHPRSRLATAYETLVRTIVAENLDDRDGALAYIRRFSEYLDRPKRSRPTNEDSFPVERLAMIAKKHSQDGEVVAMVAMVRERLGDLPEALALLDSAIASGYSPPRVLVRRARLRLLTSQDDRALEDLRAILDSADASPYELSAAIRLIAERAPQWLDSATLAAALSHADDETRFLLGTGMMSRRDSLPMAEKLLREMGPSVPHALADVARSNFILVLIGQAKFEEAMTTIAAQRAALGAHSAISDLFNYAISEWGQTGVPPRDLLAHVIAIDARTTNSSTDRNYEQCLAIAHFLAGSPGMAEQRLVHAKELTKQDSNRCFSAWRYLSTTPSEFVDDLDEMHTWLRGSEVKPVFMRLQLELVS